MQPSAIKVIFVMGGPGSGKGTQSELLAKKFGFIHLSIGNVLRNRIKEGGEIAQQIMSVMKKGELVSDIIVVKSLELQFQSKGKSNIFILDGFPRSVDNFLAYEKHTNKPLNILTLIYFECSDSTMQHRLIERAKTIDRPDNDISIIRNRIKIFHQQRHLIVSQLRQQTSIITISAQPSIKMVHQDLASKFRVLGFKRISPKL